MKLCGQTHQYCKEVHSKTRIDPISIYSFPQFFQMHISQPRINMVENNDYQGFSKTNLTQDFFPKNLFAKFHFPNGNTVKMQFNTYKT